MEYIKNGQIVNIAKKANVDLDRTDKEISIAKIINHLSFLNSCQFINEIMDAVKANPADKSNHPALIPQEGSNKKGVEQNINIHANEYNKFLFRKKIEYPRINIKRNSKNEVAKIVDQGVLKYFGAKRIVGIKRKGALYSSSKYSFAKLILDAN